MALTTVIDLKERLLDIKHNRVAQGLGLGVPEIDRFLRWKPSSFDIVVGHANTGKTTVIAYLMAAFSMKHNLKWLIFSSENTPQSIASKLIQFYTGKVLQELSDAEMESALEWVNDHFKIMEIEKLYSARTLMQEAKEIKEKFNYDGFLIDPYNSLIKDAALLKQVGGHEYDYQISSEMRLFTKQMKVSIWLCAHAVTDALRKVHPKGHDYEGHITPPSMADIEGGGKWGNRADSVMTIHRMTQHPTEWMFSEIHVKKVKEVETGGSPTPLDEPIKLRSKKGQTGFTFGGEDILHQNFTKYEELF
jgi:hypothetical protein